VTVTVYAILGRHDTIDCSAAHPQAPAEAGGEVLTLGALTLFASPGQLAAIRDAIDRRLRSDQHPVVSGQGPVISGQ